MTSVPFSQDQLIAVANRYAPIVRFHPSEIYFPCTVEWFLARGTLHGPNGYVKAQPAVNDLPVGTTDDGAWWLEMSDAVKPGDLSIAQAYLHAVWNSKWGYTDLQYWFCSGYNGPGTLHVGAPLNSSDPSMAPLGEHWVDWEQVTLRIDNKTEAVLGVYLSQHGEGEWIIDLTRFQRKNDQFIVYASHNGHANYSAVGDNPTASYDYKVVSFFLRNDTADGGPVFDTAGKIQLVAADFVPGFTPAKWLQFPYRWGRGTDSHLSEEAVGKILLSTLSVYAWIPFLNLLIPGLAAAIVPNLKLDDTNGVYGPPTQAYWTGSLIPAYRVSNGYTGLNTNNDSPPSVIGFGGLVHVFFKDHGGNGIMHITSPDGIQWSAGNPFYTGVNTSSGPCAVVYQNVLYVFFRDGSGNGILHIQSTDGNSFAGTPNWYIGQNCDGQPHAAVLGSTLCVVSVDHGGNGIMRSLQTSLNGGWNNGYTGWNTNNDSPPCIVAFGGMFHVFFKDHNGQGIMHITSTDGVTWKQPKSFYTGVNTSAGPTAAVYQDILYVFFRDGSGNGILQIQTTGGDTWAPSPCWYLGLNCDGQPALSAISDSLMALVCVDADGKNGIMRSMLTPW